MTTQSAQMSNLFFLTSFSLYTCLIHSLHFISTWSLILYNYDPAYISSQSSSKVISLITEPVIWSINHNSIIPKLLLRNRMELTITWCGSLKRKEYRTIGSSSLLDNCALPLYPNWKAGAQVRTSLIPWISR